MFIGWLTCIPAVLLPHSPCRSTTANAPANRQMPIASVVSSNCMKKITSILALLICLASCQLGHLLNNDNCIEYNDSLTIHNEHMNIRVSQTNLNQSSRIRPYSMIYDNHLVVLNKKNIFYAFDLECFTRDSLYEKRINSLNFKRAFVASDTLFGIDSNDHAFVLNIKSDKWTKCTRKLPFDNSSPIYENEKYLCYSINHGEFGGILFFYNKRNARVTYMPASRVVSIIESEKGFYVTTCSTHMMESSSIIKVNNPDSLFILPDSMKIDYKWDNMNYYYPIIARSSIYNSQLNMIYHVNDSLISSGFNVENKNYFFTQHRIKNKQKICLTTLDNDSLKAISTNKNILNKLSFSRLDRTRKYNKITVIDWGYIADDPEEWGNRDYDPYLLGTTFIVKDSSIVRINWKKN